MLACVYCWSTRRGGGGCWCTRRGGKRRWDFAIGKDIGVDFCTHHVQFQRERPYQSWHYYPCCDLWYLVAVGSPLTFIRCTMVVAPSSLPYTQEEAIYSSIVVCTTELRYSSMVVVYHGGCSPPQYHLSLHGLYP